MAPSGNWPFERSDLWSKGGGLAEDVQLMAERRRSREGPALDPFVEHPEPGPVPREDFQTIPAAIPKQEQMAGEGIEREALAYQRGHLTAHG